MGGRKEGRKGQEGRANFRLVAEGRNEGRCRRKEGHKRKEGRKERHKEGEAYGNKKEGEL